MGRVKKNEVRGLRTRRPEIEVLPEVFYGEERYSERKVTSQKGYAGQVTCKCEHGEKKDSESKDFGGCCSRKRIQERRSSASDNGCCSWRRSCCDGGCCDRIGNCCSSGSDTTAQVRDKPSTSYGYGYGYGQPAPMTAMPYQMMDAMPERVPCKRQEKKLPMCFGGDCKDDEKCESDGTETPRQSER
nr:PREDICTED: uncharacterized protein LOC100878563 isoform X2 [Megachile rotundata]XP_012143983.1 PREDICTED: uncharacterized protein LOC100878563 isoform X2 [Megachile rotundata]